MFKWDNSYDVYTADELNQAMQGRTDIMESTEEDGHHFRSEGDLQPILDVMSRNQMDFLVLELNIDVTLHAVKQG